MVGRGGAASGLGLLGRASLRRAMLSIARSGQTQSRRDRRFAGRSAPGVERAEGAADNTLAARFTDGNRLAPADACRLAYQLGLGLARLHQLGQVHGSIRPDNVWLQADGTCKLLQTPLAPEPAMGPGPIDWNAPDPNGQALLAADYAAPELAQARPAARHAHRRVCTGGDAVSNAVGLGAVSRRRRGEQAFAPCVGIAGVFGAIWSAGAARANGRLLVGEGPGGAVSIGGAGGRGVGVFRRSGRAKLHAAAGRDRQPCSINGWKASRDCRAWRRERFRRHQVWRLIPRRNTRQHKTRRPQYAAQAAMQSHAPPVAAAAPPPQPPARTRSVVL